MANANDYIDYTLITVPPGVNRYTNTIDRGGVVVDSINGETAKIVGTVYSWVTDSSGAVWWQLYETWAPNKSMYVKHNENLLVPVAPGEVVNVVNTPGLLTDLAEAGGKVLTSAAAGAGKFFAPFLITAGAILGAFFIFKNYRK